MRFLQQLWELKVLSNEYVWSSIAVQLQSGTVSTAKKKHAAKPYSKCHERRLKRQRTEDCAKVLTWLGEEGITPVRLTVFNEQTKDVEIMSTAQS